MSDATAVAAPVQRMDPGLVRTARLYRKVDHRDQHAVRREAARRRQVAQLTGRWAGTDASVEVRDTVVADAAGHEVTVRIYRPLHGTAPHPAVLYLHGGAFISGDLDFEHPRCLEMCREARVVVVSVDYRLAPEFPYPAALDDCLAAFGWLSAAGASVGVDPGRLAVVGTSAGGTLAAALCLRSRDTGRAVPRLQMLLHPVLDDRLATSSMWAFTDTPVWDHPSCVHMWNHYLGSAEHRAGGSPYAVPARATDLSGLPATYVMTAEYDPLRDEGAQYAARLTGAGVATEFHQFPGAFHGFETLASTAAISQRARREHYDVLRGALG
jgi:acetyl esterase